MRHRPTSRAAAIALVSALAAGLTAAQTPPSPRQQPLPVFGETIEVRVVNFEVVVTDKQGLPVTGLTAADFRLVVDGKERPVTYFTEVRGGDAVTPEGGVGAEIPGLPALAPGEPVGTSYLVFIDEFFAQEIDRNRVIQSLVADLPHLAPEDRMAVVAFDGRKLEMLSTWSGSQEALERALKKAMARPARGLQRVAERREFDNEQRLLGRISSERSTLDVQVSPSERYYIDRLESQVETVISGATAALRGFANPPGRRVLLMLSGGWPYNPAEYATAQMSRPIHDPDYKDGVELYRPLIETANLVGYTIYGVDVPGLSSSYVDAELDTAPTADQMQQPQLRESGVQYTLERVSRDTGGQALLNARRQQPLARVAADTRSYYWIGFQPQWQGDDQGHDVEIRVTRPGLKVRSRSGFVDLSRQREISLTVESALLFGDAPYARPLAVELGKPQKSGVGRMKVPVTLTLPADAVTFLPIDGKFVGRLELRAAALDESGGRSEVPVIPIDLSGAAAPVAGQVLRYSTTLELRRERNELLLALYDPASGVLFSGAATVAP